ncbi:MAG: alkene reductase [Mobilicoccus sp.]|nr:alkene reductase [Mobilicoccus sp.]
MTTAFDPVRVGDWTLPQRFVMAPLTRNRAGAHMVPPELSVEYYAQRAGAGLIISEATQPSVAGQAYMNIPGIHTTDQVEGWRRVGTEVHARGGRIVVQLMHSGRISHPENKLGVETVAPSAIAAPGKIVTPTGRKPYPVPRALETAELPEVIEQYVQAARNTIAAGLDGVELHSANGYLLHQFLAPSTNVRTDVYGGSPEARARFVIEVTRAVTEAIGAAKVGIRISPAHNVHGAIESDPAETRATYTALIDGIADLGLAYLHVLADPFAESTQHLRRRFGGVFIANDGFAEITTLDDVEQVVRGGYADLVAVGRPYIANPDLALRWRTGAALNEPDSATFYAGGATGYTDYPFLD